MKRHFWRYIIIGLLVIHPQAFSTTIKAYQSSAAFCLNNQCTEKKPIPPAFLGNDPRMGMLYANVWETGSFQQALKNLGSQILRYPGGDFANFWDWQNGWLNNQTASMPADVAKYLNYPKPLPQFTLDTYSNNAGAATLVDVNLLTDTLDNQLAMLNRATEVGIPITHIELGNEIYQDYAVKNIPSVQSYVLIANQWQDALSKNFPNAKIAAVASAVTDTARSKSWNQNLNSLLNMDALTMHPYPKIADLIPTSQADTPTAQSITLLLSLPFMGITQLQQGIAQLPARLQNLPIWVTEYGIWGLVNGKTPKITSTWGFLLGNSALELLLMQQPSVAMLVNINLISGENGNGKITVSNSSSELSISGELQQLFAEAVAGATAIQALEFTNQLMIQATGGNYTPPAYPALIGSVFYGSTPKAIIINLSDQTISLSLSEIFPATVGFISYSAAGTANQNMAQVNTGVASRGYVDLPPHALMLVNPN